MGERRRSHDRLAVFAPMQLQTLAGSSERLRSRRKEVDDDERACGKNHVCRSIAHVVSSSPWADLALVAVADGAFEEVAILTISHRLRNGKRFSLRGMGVGAVRNRRWLYRRRPRQNKVSVSLSIDENLFARTVDVDPHDSRCESLSNDFSMSSSSFFAASAAALACSS